MKINEPAREGFLYSLWINRAIQMDGLHTTDGESLEILEKGMRNYNAGPDFLDALIVIDGLMTRGDVEIHAMAADWYDHKHHLDPKYNNVVLHVVTKNCPDNFSTVRQDFAVIPVLNLDDFLESPAEKLEDTLSKTSHETDEIHCALSAAEAYTVQRVLEEAGDLRFANRAALFLEQRRDESWDQIFYRAMLEAFGYAINKRPFRRLAAKLPVDALWGYLWNDPPVLAQKKAEAYLLGAAGLLPEQKSPMGRSFDREIRNYAREMAALWRDFPFRLQVTPMKYQEWTFFRLRPQNFPTRRVAAAASVVLRFMDDGFVQFVKKIVVGCSKKPGRTAGELERIFKVTSNTFWSKYYCFEECPIRPSPLSLRYLIGVERARDISVNVALPGLLAYTIEADDFRLGNLVRDLYARYPRCSENEITRIMRRRFLRSSKAAIPSVTARHQQGMIQLFKMTCQAGYCNRCLCPGAFSHYPFY